MKVCNGELAMKSLGLGRRLVRRRMQGAIESTFDDAGQQQPSRDQDYDER
jgi:hypothetical protein